MLLRYCLVVLLCELGLAEIEKSSLTFVIDDTYSMSDDIEGVKENANLVLDSVLKNKVSQIENFILVTFNDPDVNFRTVTRDPELYKRQLASIHVHGGDDCEEMSMAGIELALQRSLPGSYIYVYTDASSKDAHLISRVQNLAIAKKSQVVFLLTGMCNGLDDPQYKVYHSLARASSGQVFHVTKSNVKEVLKYIAETVRNRKTSLSNKISPPGFHEMTIPVDDAMKELLISVSGTSPTLDITAPDGSSPKTDVIVDLPSVKIVKLEDTTPGNYTAKIHSISEVSVVVTAATTTHFKHGFSVVKPTAIDDTAYRPIEGENSYLSIQLITAEENFKLDSVQLVDLAGNVVLDVPLTLINAKEKFYGTKPIAPPSYLFKVVINGYDSKTNKSFTRISPTAVEPQKPVKPENMPPSVKIPSGLKIDAEYDKTLKISCKVKGYPKPDVVWTDKDGNKLPYIWSTVELPYDYIAVLELNKVTKNATYSCTAKNVFGIASNEVNVETVKREHFNVIKTPKDISIEYKHSGNVTCKVFAEPPATITWFGSGKEMHTDAYVEISPDGSVLTVKDMRKHLNGPYICEARNSVERKLFHFNIFITKFVRPKIDKKDPAIIHAERGSNVELSCRISQGEPIPQVSWFKTFDKNVIRYNFSSEVITLKNVGSEDSGTYQCLVKNAAGYDNRLFELLVEYAPSIGKAVSSVTAKDGERTHLRCDVSGSPLPRVEWYKNGERIFNDRTYHIFRDHSLRFKASADESSLFTCVASNPHGSVNHTIRVDYVVPVLINPPEESTIEKMVGEAVTLPCEADGFPRPDIKWLFYSSEFKPPSLVSRSQTLVLKNMQPRQDGYFICVATNNYSSMNMTYRIKVLAPPLIQDMSDKEYTAILGDKVLRVPCKATGNPKPDIMWKKNGLNIASGEWYNLEDDGTLLIKKLDAKSGGKYLCVAENKVGRMFKSYKVAVLPYPVVPSSVKTVFLEQGTSFNLECDIPYRRIDTLQWYKDTNVIKTTKLENVKASDAGMYVCHVSTLSNSSSSGVRVVVGTKPVFINNRPELEIVYGEHSIAFLDCEAYGHPAPQVTWVHNGKELKNTDAINEFEMDLSKRGSYTCIVTNRFGSINRTFDIFSKDCFLNSKEDFHRNQPIMTETPFLRLPLFESTNGYMKIPFEEKIILHCPSSRFVNFPTDAIEVTCERENIFKFAGRHFRYSDLTCVDEVTPVLRATGKKCSLNNSEIVKIGFEVPGDFFEAYEICLDKDKNTPIYSKQKLHKSLADFEPTDDVEWIFQDEVPLDLKEAYDCAREITGISTRLRKWFHPTKDCCFKKRLLVNPKDLLAGISQKAAFMSLNVVPQWSTCNSENWDEMEQRLRNYAKESLDDLVVWTGTAGQLQLPNDIGVSQDIILDDQNGNEQPVPFYLWKVIQNPGTKSSLAIVQLNVPDISVEEAYKHMFCRDICRDIPWLAESFWRDSSRGYTFCCHLDDFETALGYKGRFGIGNNNVLYGNFLISDRYLI